MFNKLSPSGSHTDRLVKKVLLFVSSNCENVVGILAAIFHCSLSEIITMQERIWQNKIVKTVKKKYLLVKSFYWEKKIDIYVTRSSDRKKPLKMGKCPGRQISNFEIECKNSSRVFGIRLQGKKVANYRLQRAHGIFRNEWGLGLPNCLVFVSEYWAVIWLFRHSWVYWTLFRKLSQNSEGIGGSKSEDTFLVPMYSNFSGKVKLNLLTIMTELDPMFGARSQAKLLPLEFRF